MADFQAGEISVARLFVVADLWRPIEGWPPYEVSADGRVRRGDTLAVLRGQIRNKYPAVTLRKNLRSVPHDIHRLVAAAFIGPIPPGMTVNHKDCDKTNNCVDNLEVISHAANMRHAYANGRMRLKLTDEQADEIARRGRCGESARTIAKDFQIKSGYAAQIIAGLRRSYREQSQ